MNCGLARQRALVLGRVASARPPEGAPHTWRQRKPQGKQPLPVGFLFPRCTWGFARYGPAGWAFDCGGVAGTLGVFSAASQWEVGGQADKRLVTLISLILPMTGGG